MPAARGARPSGWPALTGQIAVVGAIVLAGWGVGVMAPGVNLEKHGVVLVGLCVAMLALPILLRDVSYERLFALMVLTLPLLHAFSIFIGGKIRITYLVSLVALAVGLYTRKLRKVDVGVAGQLLVLFVAYALVSTVFTLSVYIPVITHSDTEAFRLSPFRTYIQAGQLLLMVLAFYLALDYASSKDRLARFAELVFWSTPFVTVYGLYEFVMRFLGWSWVRLGRIETEWELSVTIAGVTLPRPQSTLSEPIELAIFLLFAVPFCIVSIIAERRPALRLFKIAWTVLAVVLFVCSNSRAAVLGLIAVLPVALLCVRSRARRVRLVARTAITVLVLVLMLVVALGAANTGRIFGDTWERVSSLMALAQSLEGSREAKIALGRDYLRPIGVFQDQPVFGVGLGNYPFYARKDAGELVLMPTFSVYLRLLTELGLVGTTLFLAFMGRIVWQLARSLTHVRDPALRRFVTANLLAIIGVMVSRLGTDGLTTDSYVWVMFATGLASARIAGRTADGANRDNTTIRNAKI